MNPEKKSFLELLPCLLTRVEDALAKCNVSQRLRTRVLTICRRQHIYLLGELAYYSEAELLKMKYVGRRTVAFIREMLQQFGLQIAPSFIEEQWLTIRACSAALQQYFDPSPGLNAYLLEKLMDENELSKDEAIKLLKIAEKHGWIKPEHNWVKFWP